MVSLTSEAVKANQQDVMSLYIAGIPEGKKLKNNSCEIQNYISLGLGREEKRKS